MAKEYKEYNKYSQQDKDSMRTAMAEKSNENETTLLGQTDELEDLLKETNAGLTAVNTTLTEFFTKMGTDYHQVYDEISKVLLNAQKIADNFGTLLLSINDKLDKLTDIEVAIKAVDASVQKADTDIVAAILAASEVKTLTAENINNTPGNFRFMGQSDGAGTYPQEGCDWTGMQISSGVDTIQIVGSNGLWVRRNDGTLTESSTKADWGEWCKITTTPELGTEDAAA